tara:strand:+ start:21425 stop:21766 length:342 start_codon:yes stop_codon:yes gene_type:complete
MDGKQLMHKFRHTPNTKKVVKELILQGLSSREVAKQANKICKNELQAFLTRNSVLGLKERMGLCKKSNREYAPRKHSNKYDKSLAYEEKPDFINHEESRKHRLTEALKKYSHV